MNIYLLSHNRDFRYDTYDSCVVSAKDVESAIIIHPSGHKRVEWWLEDMEFDSWVRPEEVFCCLIGKSISEEEGVICARFNAG